MNDRTRPTTPRPGQGTPEHVCEIDEKPDCCAPRHPCHDQHDVHSDCRGDITGQIVLHCDNHCHKLKTRSFVVQLGPQTEVQLRAYMQNTLNAWNNANYVVMAHSVIDTGAGWAFVFTVGWYV